jgi:uncharacterized protein YaiE (UPF0345 family)
MATRMQQRRGTAAQWTSANPVLAAGEIGFEIDTNKFKMGDGINQWADLGYFLDETALGGSFDDYIPLTEKGEPNGVATLDGSGAIPVSQLGNLIADAPALLDTLEEIAAALGDDPDFASKVVPIVKKTTTQWEADTDPIAAGTIAYDTTTSTFKVGNGTNPWSTTAYMWNGSQVATHVTNEIGIVLGSSAVFTGTVALPGSTTLNGESLLDQVSEIAGLLTASATVDGEISVIQSDIVALQTGLSTAETALSDLDTEVTNLSTSLSGDITTLQGDLATAETSLAGVVSDFALHDAKTTNVHGIADTSALATQSQVSAAQTNAETTASTALTAHAEDTTSVHGISDTSKLVYLDATAQTLTGSLDVEGTLTIDGDLVVNGTTTTVSATDLVVSDPLIYIGEGNTANLVDIGIVGNYNDGTYQHTGLVRDASAGTWKLFKGVTDEPTTTVNFTQGSLDDIQVAGLTASSVTATSATIGGVAFTEKADKTATINTMSGAHTAVLADVNNIREMSNGGTFTIPADNAFWPVGQRVEVIQTGSSQVTIAADAGVTINATPGLKLRAQWSGATIIKRAANTFVVLGDLAV